MTDDAILERIAAHLDKARAKHPRFTSYLFDRVFTDNMEQQLQSARRFADRPKPSAWDLICEEYAESAEAAMNGDFRAAAEEALDAAAVCVRMAIALFDIEKGEYDDRS